MSLLFLGCSQSTPPRPLAGDRVTPELFLIEPWRSESKVQVTIRLQTQNDKEPKPALLKFEEIPYEAAAQATVIFSRDDVELARFEDLPLERDC